MKAKAYFEMFDEFKTVAEISEKNEAFGKALKRLVDGLLDEASPLFRRGDMVEIRRGLIELNHKFRVVRGMLKTKYGESVLRYDGFATFFLKTFSEIIPELPGIEKELLG